MSEPLPPQSAASHTKWDPLFHFVLAPLFLINVITRIVEVVRLFMASGGEGPLLRSAWALVIAIGLLLMVFKMRIYSLKVQDRLIRLEERMRMMSVLPEPLLGRIDEITPGQFIALRFASDGELPEIVRTAIDKQLAPKEIKQAIKYWRPDHFRV